MSAPKFDPTLVEQAARALLDARRLRWDNVHQGECITDARAVLTAVAPTLRAEGITAKHGPCICNTGPGTDGPDEFCPHHGRTYNEAWAAGDDAYQRGKVDGARQVANTVEEAHTRTLGHPWWVAVSRMRAAAREAVARIEGGAA